MKKIYTVYLKMGTKLALLIFFSSFSFAQNSNRTNAFWDNVRYGGGIGLGFGNDTFNASLAPSAIYQVNPYFATGVGLNFNYAKFRNQKLLAYGGSVLGLVNPIREIQLSAEFEELRVNRSLEVDGAPNLEDNYWSPALFLGIGYVNQNFTIGVRYDVLYDNTKSIYANAWMPFVRVYF